MIKEGIEEEHRYALASLLVCTLDDKSIGGLALGSDGERELRLLEKNIQRVLDELNGDPVSKGFNYQPVGVLDLSRPTIRFAQPELYFVQPTEELPLREVRTDSTELLIPNKTNLLFIYDIGAESFMTIKSALNFRPIYKYGRLIAVGVGQDNTGVVPYAGIRSENEPSYRGLHNGLRRGIPALLPILGQEGYENLLIKDVQYSRLNGRLAKVV